MSKIYNVSLHPHFYQERCSEPASSHSGGPCWTIPRASRPSNCHILIMSPAWQKHELCQVRIMQQGPMADRFVPAAPPGECIADMHTHKQTSGSMSYFYIKPTAGSFLLSLRQFWCHSTWALHCRAIELLLQPWPSSSVGYSVI